MTVDRARWPAAAVATLACPVCPPSTPAGALAEVEGGLVCGAGHRFDAARQGYVHLAATPIRHAGDTAAMVAARERVQAVGLFEGLTAAVVEAVPTGARVVLDVGAGTGHHLAAVLRAHGDGRAAAAMVDTAGMPGGSTVQGEEGVGEGAVGIALDTSKAALRRAARAHGRLLAVAADVTGRLPVTEGAVDAALVTFAPRAAAELARVIAAGGVLVVAVPTTVHLAEVRSTLGMLDVPSGKDAALREALGGAFDPLDRVVVTRTVTVDRATAADLALMGPAGFHTTAGELATRAATLDAVTGVTIDLVVNTFRRR